MSKPSRDNKQISAGDVPKPTTEVSATCAKAVAGIIDASGMNQGLGQRRLPAPERVAEACFLYRRLLFPEVWTTDHAPDPDELTERCTRLHGLLEDLLLAERLAKPSRSERRTLEDSPTALSKATAWARKTASSITTRLPAVRLELEEDLEAFMEGDPAVRSRAEVVLCYPGFHAIETYRFAHQLWLAGAQLVARLMNEQAHGKTGIDLHPGATIGPAFFIDHGTGVVVGETSIIGRRVRLYQGVTIGARSVPSAGSRKPGKRHPTIEDEAVIYANATILGGDTIIGHGAMIGGNAWVTTSVPAGARLRLELGARVADAVVMVPDGAQPE